MPWQQLAHSRGFLLQGIVVADLVWESDSQFMSPSAASSLVTVVLLQVFCKVAVSKNTFSHTSEITQDLYKTQVHYWEEIS